MTSGRFDFIEQDRRIIEQKLRKHQLSQQDHQKFLKNLPDEEKEAEEFHVLEEDLSNRQKG